MGNKTRGEVILVNISNGAMGLSVEGVYKTETFGKDSYIKC